MLALAAALCKRSLKFEQILKTKFSSERSSPILLCYLEQDYQIGHAHFTLAKIHSFATMAMDLSYLAGLLPVAKICFSADIAF